MDSESNSHVCGDDSLNIPTPERFMKCRVSPIGLPNKVAFVAVSQLQKIVEAINAIRGCRTASCEGALVPVRVKHIGLGVSISVSYACNGCGLKNVVFESSARYDRWMRLICVGKLHLF